ncbi:MAG: glycosyltransferase family 2 protein [Deltaproteobacteria bacterium]|nr:glycosyltransferase family 2 protein [Deltaproteobacteria bacterium]
MVYIIVLNYKTWKDTVECLESIYGNSYDNYRVIIVDNNSENNSVEYIKDWVRRKKNVKIPENYIVLDENFSIENNADGYYNDHNARPPLIIIKALKNRGFAAGNNLGIKYALYRNDFEYIWLLNNDTVIDKDSLTNLVSKAQEYDKHGEKIGIIGSKILFYDNKDVIQGIGVKYNKWIGTVKYIGLSEKDAGQFDDEKYILSADYVIGASMFATRAFLKETGLLSEDYFLYFEELDWVLRGKRVGFNIGYSWKSRVYHKEGATVGSSSKGKLRSEKADYYTFKNRIVFTKKFFPKSIFTVYAGFIFVAFNRIKRGQFKRLGTICSALKDGRNKSKLINE